MLKALVVASIVAAASLAGTQETMADTLCSQAFIPFSWSCKTFQLRWPNTDCSRCPWEEPAPPAKDKPKSQPNERPQSRAQEEPKK